MVVLGLTGSIGMGKSTAAGMLKAMGAPVCDSDAVVHRLLGPGGRAVPAIDAAFPGVVIDGAVSRPALGAAVFRDPSALKRLEAILHPMVQAGQRDFLAGAARRGAKIAVLDIPLLFETHGERRVDATVVVSAPFPVQRARVMARPGMTAEKFAGILARQMPDAEKRRRADYVVPTGAGRLVTRRALQGIVRDVVRRRGRHWPPRGYQPGQMGQVHHA
ncbi:dephospho-CoA kinase [Azospirillum sp. TSO35-2]|uniref:dephospho-CoA kinase n=1 Tax=Azospirillum sp. TSO35-2 TaxID=716796 RepID=UPI000D615A40|nr:dephospho-CoA kinase [Azospirillum sp. TSO35-2]PWC32259.1 dephospho-CoA kinase [Azospirillum sp. TSO35-2]